MIFPSGYRITQRYGERPEVYRKFGFAGHEGLDVVPAMFYQTICAVEGGIVVRDVDAVRDNYGIYVVIWNRTLQRGWWYCHLANNVVQIGDTIVAGQPIGKMGSTGKSTGPHLHLGLRMTDVNGMAVGLSNGFKGFVDPLPMLKFLEAIHP